MVGTGGTKGAPGQQVNPTQRLSAREESLGGGDSSGEEGEEAKTKNRSRGR